MCLTPSTTFYDSGAIRLYELHWNNNSKQKKWVGLAGNPAAIPFLKKYHILINWDELSKNPHPTAIKMLKANPDKINYYYLCMNSSAMELIFEKWKEEQSMDKFSKSFRRKKNDPKYLDYSRLSENPAAVQFLIERPELIDWTMFCCNPAARDVIIAELRKPKYMCRIIKPSFINGNPAMIKFLLEKLKNDPYSINFDYVYSNPAAMEIVQFIYDNYPERLNWYAVYENPAAIPLITEHLKNHASNGRLKQLGGYNYWTKESYYHAQEATKLLKESDSWKDNIRMLFDRTNEDRRAKMDVEKYEYIKNFETIQKKLFVAYRVDNSESLIKQMKINQSIAKNLIDCESVVHHFEEMRLKRNLLAHEVEERINDDSNQLGCSFTVAELQSIEDYRTLKHFSFIQAKLIDICQPENIWDGKKLIADINWNSKEPKSLLGPNALKAYRVLKDNRNNIAHLIGERREYI